VQIPLKTPRFHYLYKKQKGGNSMFVRELPPIPLSIHNLNAWTPRGTGYLV